MVGVPIFQPASRKMAQTKISNINRPLRLNQKQELRVNTGKDFCPPAVFTQLKTTGSQTETE
jgi:hypothetical protein